MANDIASFPSGFAAAVALSEAGDLAGANAAYRRLLIDTPDAWPCYSNLGLHLRKTRKTLAAGLRALRCGVVAGATDARAHTMYGDGLRQAGNFPAAARAYGRGLARDAHQNAGFFKAYGSVLFEMRCLEAALAAFARGQELAPDDHEFLAHRAHVLNALGRFDEALACCETAMAALKEPADAPLYLRNAHATVLICLGRCADADKLIAAWPAEEQDDINVLTVKARSAMLQGQLGDGWKLIAPVWRHRLGARKQMPGAIWRGEDVTGKSIILFCEQGMGDSVQFIRYAPMVAARGARVIVSCQPALKTIFKQIAGVDAVYGENEPLPAADFNCALPDLPAIFGTTLATIPADMPYLPLPTPSPRADNNSLRVALTWAGNPAHQNDRARSLSLKQLAPLLSLPGVRCYCFQVGDPQREVAQLNLTELLPVARTSFADGRILKALAQIDVVVTVDTSIAHIAGAAGVPVWLLLGTSPDWRWLLDREDTPWYPSMRLFRQPADGDWAGVIDRVAGELRQWAAERPVQSPSAAPKRAAKA